MLLQPNLDVPAAAPLRAELLRARGAPLDLDASAVDRLGGLCLQVLLSARATWQADGVAFRIVNPSEAFRRAAAVMAADGLLCGESGI